MSASGFPRERSQSCPEARHVNLYRARGVATLVEPLAPAEPHAVPPAEPGEHDGHAQEVQRGDGGLDQAREDIAENLERESLLKRLFSVSLSQLGKVIFLPARHIRNFEELVAVLSDCWSACLASRDVGGFLFVRSERKSRINAHRGSHSPV
jgi:hypothetical protein